MSTHKHESCRTQYVCSVTGRLHCLHTRDSEGQAGCSKDRHGMAGHMCMEPHEDRGRTEVISGCIAFCVHIELVMLLVVSRMYS